jgi:spore coat polysaccharide biosynthesis predicted glycosyltransferase SpsG
MRCLTLADAMRDAGVDDIRFRVFDADGANRRIVTGRGFAMEESKQHVMEAGELAAMQDCLQGQSADPLWLVLDSKRADAAYVQACRQHARVLCIDDELHRDLPCELLLNNHLGQIDGVYGEREGRQLLLGPGFNNIRKAFFEVGENNAGGSAEGVLITLGGEDPHNHTSWALEHLGDLLADRELTVIVGPAHPDADAVERSVAEHAPHARLVRRPTDLAPYMAGVGLAITAGGTTCYELAAARVAQLVIVVEDHQQELVDSLLGHQAVSQLGRFDDMDPVRAHGLLADYLSDAAKRRDLITHAAGLFDQPGAPRVVRFLLDYQ